MRLTHIKLAGFKSFADPTAIAVPGQLVAVVGPNGCGKSNVIDAVRWVLGEASAKQLRGESMQDVIFNGAATRKAAPRAYVELVFNNDQNMVNGSWGQYAEISIKRQLTRQGESSYYINHQVVRRRDITDLFLGTGVGARGYAVIEQGMISRIIEARPEELRAYIEEAAGVSKYKDRRRETESRLKDSCEHLQRLADLQSELDRQTEKLQRQAKTAERYQTLKNELAQWQNLLDYVQWQQALNQADAATLEYEQHKAAQTTLAAQIQSLSETEHDWQQQEQTQQQKVHDLGSRRAVLREQWARLEEQIRHRRQWQQRYEREQAHAAQQCQRLQQEAQQLADEQETIAVNIEEQQLTWEEWAIHIADFEAQLPPLIQQTHELEHQQRQQQQQLADNERELAVNQQQQQHAANALRQLQQRAERLYQELAALKLPENAEVESAQTTADTLAAEVQALEEALAQCDSAWNEGQTQRQAATQAQQQAEQQRLTIEAQLYALQALQPADNPLADFWENTDQKNAPILWQHLHVHSRWQHAVSAALGKRLHARLTAADFTPPHPLPQGAAAWVHHQPSEKQYSADSLLAQIQCAPYFQAALNQWLNSVFCADCLNDALARQAQLSDRQALITPEGHWVDSISVQLFADNISQNPLQYRQQIKHLETELANLAEPLAQLRRNSEEARRAIDEAAAKRNQLHSRLKQQQQNFQAARMRADELLTQQRQGAARHGHILTEQQHIAEEEAQYRETQQQAAAAVETLMRRTEEQRQQQTNHQQQHNAAQTAERRIQTALQEARRQHSTAEIELHKWRQRQQIIQEKQAHLTQQTEEWQTRQTELALAHDDGNIDAEQAESLAQLNAEINALDEASDAAQTDLHTIQQHTQNAYEQRQRLEALLPQQQTATQESLLRQQEALLTAKSFYQQLHNQHVDTAQLAAITAAENHDSDSLHLRITAVNQRIHGLGAVNLAALEELNEAAARQRYYQEQTDDIQAAIALLQEAIAQIDNETQNRFQTTFNAVNSKVQSYFPTLFGGGEAALHLVGDDWLHAGVSIMARPPGKKNSTIHLLSGGEKALTAMSLVFALFSLNPAPFCLLDEVDAPLDDANTERFCRLVKEMSAHTQFLYISHNRLTMEMAEQLVGVTMQEKGVSRIVTVDIQAALNMAET
ncbi:chromosome segregation protein SMC [Stenoxybacter acetivorans]|uniref:chromosome segregation protein SMC n=1 Tax=Stenoxybacter acetivorans TaxID=422441 RepID=UPI0005679AB6|nr:chromosome segregation protein SMC [Stenoxybacter acetivorans]